MIEIFIDDSGVDLVFHVTIKTGKKIIKEVYKDSDNMFRSLESLTQMGLL